METFNSELHQLNYQSSIDAESYYDCEFCFECFSCEKKLAEHVDTHDQLNLRYFCGECTIGFANSWARRNHDCPQKLFCRYCGKVMDSKLKKEQHEQDHCDDQYGVLCEMCGKMLRHTFLLLQHHQLEHPDHSKEFQCPKCPRKYKFQTKLKYHLKTSHVLSDAHICQACNIHFKNKAGKKQHDINKHGAMNHKETCSICLEQIPIFYIKKHMATHESRNSSESFTCQGCKRCFSTEHNLKTHIRKSHELMKCSVCEKKFTSSYCLNKHKMIEHGDFQKTFSCTECFKKFVSHSEFKLHIAHHSEMRLYGCAICEFKAKTKSNLVQHIRDEHEPGRNFECADCASTFKRESDLIRHQKSHSRSKLYSCDVCHKNFKYSSNKKRHEKIHANPSLSK